MNPGWKTHRIIVEIPAVGITTRALVYRVEDCLNAHLETHAKSVGRVRVKSQTLSEAAQARKEAQ